MDSKKLALLVVFAFGISAIILYQTRSSRRPASSSQAVSSQPAVASSAPVQTTTVQSFTPPPKDEFDPIAVSAVTLSIPQKGWGRNPFLTVDELAKLREPVKPVEPAKVETVVVTVPTYFVSAILIPDKEKAKSAVVDSRIVRVGDRIGAETVKEITQDAVILESSGKTRKLQLGAGTEPVAKETKSPAAPPEGTEKK